ncbi:MAG: UvrD-helicase domain-containing protein, partial [Clostridia bacterium]|nr:UvrD-helicase domain-containing protein [Clostridia bacterium]
MSIELKPEQKAAVEREGRVIVSASAGSGKTFVMIERLVQRILSGTDIRSVLCVTFTNKAAAQMREKLRTALLNEITRREGKDCAHLKAQLNALPLADISTIHAFCARLIRTYFYSLDIDPSFRIISPDDAEGKTLSARAINETFDNAYERGGEDFSRLLAVYFRKKKDARLRGIVLDLLGSVRGNPDYRTVLGQVGKEDLFEKACITLFEGYRERAQFLLEEIDERGAFFAEKNSKALEVCRDIVAACERLLGAKNLFEMTALAAEPPAIHRMPSATKAAGEELANLKFLSGASKAVKALYLELKEYESEEQERLRYEDGQNRAAALAALALEYDEIYTRLKREANVLDYDDLEQFALQILSNEETRKEISEKYKLVFVDEYQDVNPVQERILFAVADSEVFLVGDEKQAIYGFRGSRSAYFKKKREELENSLSLTYNFRSAPAILDAVNRVFIPVFESYTPMQSGGRYEAHAGSVHFHWAREEEEEET